MAKGAISIQIFPSSILAFIFLCSITILADPKPPDPDIPIAIENGRNGNLGEWEHFVQQAYQISSQCYRVPEQNTIFSNRLHVRCKQEPQAEVLDSDPDAFPDEDDEGLTPALQPTMMESITVDPKSNITIECNELMEKCKNTLKCPMPKLAKKWGEKWHGFRVTRRRDGFQIELPFGNGDGNDTKIDVPDDEHPQFFINFAKEKNLLTEIIRGSISDPKESTDKRKYTVVDEKDGEKIKTYIKAREWGIDLNDVKGLWMLAMDILPLEEKQLFKKGNVSEIDEPMIRWFTKSKPTIETTEECVEIDEKLQINDITKEYKIISEYLTPSAADPQNDGFFGQKQKFIEVKENKPFIEKIEYQILDGTTIRIRAQSTKEKFTIKLLIGFKREDDYLGELVFKIVVDFKKFKPADQCYAMDVNKNKIACDDHVNPFLRTNEMGKPFWFQLEIKNGTEIHFNFDCTELIVPVEKIPYNPDAYIKIEGELKLFKVEKGKLLNIIKEGNIMADNFPTLTITNLKDNLTGDNVLYISGGTRKDSKIKITLVQLDSDEQIENMTLIGIIEVNITKEGTISAKLEETNLLTVCLVQNQFTNDHSIFVLLSRNDKNEVLLTINGMQISCQKNVSNFNYVQVYGDILMNDSPMLLTNFAKKYKTSQMFDTILPTTLYSYLNFVLIIFDDKPSAAGEKIKIYLECPSCQETIGPLIALTIDLQEKILRAEFNTWTKILTGLYKWIPEFRNKKLPTNCTIGQPIWFTIIQEQQQDGETVNYKIIINGDTLLYFDIKFDPKLKYPYVQEIQMKGDLFLFNKIIPFPLGYRMKSNESDKLPENLQINVKGMVMPNAEKLEFILASRNSEQNINISHLHVKAEQKNNEICIETKYIQGPCNASNASIHKKSPFIEGNTFSLELIGTNWDKESLIVQINGKNFTVKGGNFGFDASYLMILGDMILFDSPKCEPECPSQ